MKDKLKDFLVVLSILVALGATTTVIYEVINNYYESVENDSFKEYIEEFINNLISINEIEKEGIKTLVKV